MHNVLEDGLLMNAQLHDALLRPRVDDGPLVLPLLTQRLTRVVRPGCLRAERPDVSMSVSKPWSWRSGHAPGQAPSPGTSPERPHWPSPPRRHQSHLQQLQAPRRC
eukprot:23502-Eustigmatos_ZCMA.PRE.1